MGIFGMGSGGKKSSKAKKTTKAKGKGSAEAKAMLKKMEAKKAAGDCPFC